MKHIPAIVLGVVAVCCGAEVAPEASEESGSRTHWLSRCSTATDCGASLSCENSRCQYTCSQHSDCKPLSGDAQCVETEAESDSSWCQAGCADDSDCDAYPGLQCVASLCAASDKAAFDPCEGKACGESCQRCDPTDLTCNETGEPKACDQDGRCGEPYNTDCDGDLPCSTVNAESCTNSGCYEAAAAPVAAGSAAELEVVGCIEKDAVCSPGDFCALDSDGECWRFVNSCISSAFGEIDCAHAACVANSTAPLGFEECEGLGHQAQAATNEALSGVPVCETDVDCVARPVPEHCWASCSPFVVGGEEYLEAFEDALNDGLAAGYCAAFREGGCAVAPASCPITDGDGRELTGYLCVEQKCVAQFEE